MLSVCRRQGIPARYVSGYLYTGEHAPLGGSEAGASRSLEQGGAGTLVAVAPDAAGLRNDVKNDVKTETEQAAEGTPEEELVGGNAMHAWVECLMPNEQWRGFDPTNNLVTNDWYIKSHYGRDYGDVLPVRGLYRGPSANTMDVAVHVRREPDRQ